VKTNPYIPFPMRIEEIVLETEDRKIKTFVLGYLREGDRERFTYVPGQFAEVSVFGKGEAPFGMASTPTRPERLEFSVSTIGVVTGALHNMETGQIIGVRGPLGNGYPLEALKKKNLLLIGGGFGFSTLRSLTNYILHEQNRKAYGDLTVIYGARKPGLLLYKEDLEAWQQGADVQVHLSVDVGAEGWQGHVGLVPNVVREVAPSAGNTVAIVCGPPIMMKFTLPVVKDLGFRDEEILFSLEMRMKCGIGKCGRCNVGSRYVCSDGPVFSQSELARMPGEAHF
jgi:sulfhydrogenase subunit gamma (sulfur reductase)